MSNDAFEETLKIGPEFEGLRLDQFLGHFFDQESRSYFQRLIEKNAVQLNGKTVKKRQILKNNDCVHICFEQSPEICLEAQNIPLEILYEDDDLILINKEAGMVVHPGVGNPSKTIVNALLYYCKDLPQDVGSLRPGIVHRLDKDTSGVLALAKTKRAQMEMSRYFADRKIHKEYLAIVHGNFEDQIVDAAIGRDKIHRKKMCIREDGRPALTDCKIIARENNYSLVKAIPKTGRTHQIRVHCQSLKAPIIGDELYGSKSINDKFKCRQMLHAQKLQFQHPFTHEKICITAALPEDFNKLLKRLFPKV